MRISTRRSSSIITRVRGTSARSRARSSSARRTTRCAVTGKDLGEAAGLAADFRGMMQGAIEPDEDEFGELIALKGVVKYPVRIKCAVLAWDVLQEALQESGSASTREG